MHRYWTILKEQRRPLKFLLSRLLMKSGLCERIVMQRDGYRIRFHPAALPATMWINSEEKSSEEAFLRRCVRPGDTVLDIGANVGTIALSLMDSLAPGGRVVAVEAHPKIFAYLSDNLALNQGADGVTAMNIALGAERGRITFSDMSADTQNYVLPDGTGGLDVPMERLDDVAPEEPIALLKLDVEGYEGEVLEGARETLARTEMLYMECIPAFLERFGWSEERLCALVAEAGLRIYEIQGETLIENTVGSRGKKMLACLRQPEAFCRRTNIRIAP